MSAEPWDTSPASQESESSSIASSPSTLLPHSGDVQTPDPTDPPVTQDALDLASVIPSFTPHHESFLADPSPNSVELAHHDPALNNANPPLSNLTNDNRTVSHEKGKFGAKADVYIESDRDVWRRPLAGIAPRRSQRLHSRRPYFVVDRAPHCAAVAPHFYSPSSSTSRPAAHLALGLGRSRTPLALAARPPALFPYLRDIAAGAHVDLYASPTQLRLPSPFSSPMPLSCGLMEKTRVRAVSAAVLPLPIALLSGGDGRVGGSQGHGQVLTYAGEEQQGESQGAASSRGCDYGPDRVSAGNAGTGPVSYSYSGNPPAPAPAWNSPQAAGFSYGGRGGYKRAPYDGERGRTASDQHRGSEDHGGEDELPAESEEEDDDDESDEGEPSPWSEAPEGGMYSSAGSAPPQFYASSQADGHSGYRYPSPHPAPSSSRAVAAADGSTSFAALPHRAPPRPGTKKRGNLPRSTTDLLKAWIHDHADHPYPTEDEKRQLCHQTGMNSVQMSNWMINARRRILPQNNKGRYQRYPSGPQRVPDESTPGPSAQPSTSLHGGQYMRPGAPTARLPYNHSTQAPSTRDGGMQPRARLPSLTLPLPGTRNPMPRLDRPQVLSPEDPDSSLTLPPLRLPSDAPSHRRSGSDGYIPSMDSLSAGLPPVSRLPRAGPVPESMDAPPRSASTRPYLRGNSNNFVGSGQNNMRVHVPRSYTPEPSASDAYVQASTRMPSLASPSRTRTAQQPGFSQPARASRGMSSTEENVALHGYTPAENPRPSGSD